MQRFLTFPSTLYKAPRDLLRANSVVANSNSVRNINDCVHSLGLIPGIRSPINCLMILFSNVFYTSRVKSLKILVFWGVLNFASLLLEVKNVEAVFEKKCGEDSAWTWETTSNWKDMKLLNVELFTRYLDHTQRRTTVGMNPLDKCSARRRYLYLTTHNTHNRQTSVPAVGFETTFSAGERPQWPAHIL